MPTNYTDELTRAIERRAVEAQGLTGFEGFSLAAVKKQLVMLLAHVGRAGIFDQYTRHDITHINELMDLAEWVIPGVTKDSMSPADWLLLTLSIYFHDLGMLVSTTEFADREASGFPAFRQRLLTTGDRAEDYAASVGALGGDRDSFLYQEYVRHTHAQRIRAWVDGQWRPDLGISREVGEELERLLAALPAQFRHDLGVVCESHHLDDLDDVAKYSVSRPYSTDPRATANLQYCAIILRTVDLLHMTRDRTPPICFALINPSDPISQREWAKQMGVTSVRAALKRNRDDEVDASIQSDTIEVHARFSHPAGFFALNQFLSYVRRQLTQSVGWAKAGQKHTAKPYHFPWRDIDESHVAAVGFEPRAFEFSIDQAKILDLLTGHTIYNDSTVAVRELVQNAIDAVRAFAQERATPVRSGTVLVRWNSADRVLEIRDTGTGMTQDIVERHLLRVGSSRYQSDEFKKTCPGFSPISRFGIGLLSCFMVADDIEICTKHVSELHGRQLSLRSVHGRYLVRHLAVGSEELKTVGDHGTLVRVKLRPTAKIGDVAAVVRKWVVFPPCEVAVQIDNRAAERVGWLSPADALRAVAGLSEGSHDPSNPPDGAVMVKEVERRGVTVAFAVKWSQYFRTWAMLEVPEPRRSDEDWSPPDLGICVEGIRVEFGTPGFQRTPFYAIANATGPAAPRTNVARSALEATPEQHDLLSEVYAVYAEHIAAEVMRLRSESSITWAAREGRYLAMPLVPQKHHPTARQLLLQQLRTVPLFAVEFDGKRQLAKASDVDAYDTYWTLVGELPRAAEQLLLLGFEGVSLASLSAAFPSASVQLPAEPIFALPELDELAHVVLRPREVTKFVVRRSERRVDLQWALGNPGRWEHFRSERARSHSYRGRQVIAVALEPNEIG